MQKNKKDLFLLYVIVLLGIIVRFVFLTRQGLWNNEFITVFVIKNDWATLFIERISNNHMPLYFFLAKLSTLLLGLSEASMRLPSAIIGSIFIISVAFFSQQLFGGKKALLATFAASFHEVFLETSLDARPYIFLSLTVMANIYFFYRMLERGKRTDGIFYVIVNTIGIFNHLFHIIALPINIVWLYRKGIKGKKCYILTLLPALVLIFPIMLWLQKQYFTEGSQWQWFKFGAMFRTLFFLSLGDDGSMPFRLQRIISIPVFVWFAYRFFAHERGDEKAMHSDFFKLCKTYFAVPIIIIVVFSINHGDVLGMLRYYSISAATLPFIAVDVILNNRKIKDMERKLLVWAYVAVVFGIGAGYLSGYGAGLRESIKFLEKNAGEDSALFVCKYSIPVGVALDFYGELKSKPVGIEKSFRDEKIISDMMDENVRGKNKLWIMMYHYGKNKIFEIAGKKYPLVKKYEFNEVDVYEYEVNQTAVVQNPGSME